MPDDRPARAVTLRRRIAILSPLCASQRVYRYRFSVYVDSFVLLSVLAGGAGEERSRDAAAARAGAAAAVAPPRVKPAAAAARSHCVDCRQSILNRPEQRRAGQHGAGLCVATAGSEEGS